MERVVGARYAIDAEGWQETDFGLKEHRQVLENAALAVAFAEDVGDLASPEIARVLNRLAAGRGEDS
jgi:hypothetical protein